MSSGFGRNFDRAAAAYDAMLPPEDPPPVEQECIGCGEVFESDEPQLRCDKCQKVFENS
jgi:hypothetical protein